MLTIEEVSAGRYRAVGTDRRGHKVVSSGTDTDALLQECRAEAGAHVHPKA